MRANGVSVDEARKQLGTAKAGTAGYVVRESALDAAFSSNTESAREASLMGLTSCVGTLNKA